MNKKKYKIKIFKSMFAFLIIFNLNYCSDSNIKKITVKKSLFNNKIHSIGTLRASKTTYIGCPKINNMWAFTIVYMAKEGEKVNKGDRLIEFDKKRLYEELRKTSMNLETMKKELSKIKLIESQKKKKVLLKLAENIAKTEKARRKTLLKKELIALNALKKIKLDLKLAQLEELLTKTELKAQQTSMKTKIYIYNNRITLFSEHIKELNLNIKRMTVLAPKSGVVIYSTKWDGKKRSVGEECWYGETIIELPDLNRMEVELEIDEIYAGKVKENLPVEIRLDLNPNRVFKGRIESISRIFREQSLERPFIVFDAVATIDKPDTSFMRPGMTSMVAIILSEKQNVIQIPEKAVRYIDNKTFVWKKTLLGKKLQRIYIGDQSGNMFEIIKGLKTDDIILYNINKENVK